MPTKRAVSAGGVVFSLKDDAIYVVLCGRTATGTWTLPKGTVAKGETIEETAIREVREETGLDTEIVTSLGTIEYWFVGMPERVRFHKTVHHFLMKPIGGDIARHDWEFDVVRWVDIDEAYRILSYDNEIEIMRKAEQSIRDLVASGWQAGPNQVMEGRPETGRENHLQDTM